LRPHSGSAFKLGWLNEDTNIAFGHAPHPVS